jgi:hypothetical protein
VAEGGTRAVLAWYDATVEANQGRQHERIGAVRFGAITRHATLVAATVRWPLFGWRIR